MKKLKKLFEGENNTERHIRTDNETKTEREKQWQGKQVQVIIKLSLLRMCSNSSK